MQKLEPNMQAGRIRFHLIESDEFLGDFAIMYTWTPFQAACLIRGMKPGPVQGGVVNVGVVCKGALDQTQLDEFEPVDLVAADDLISIARSIRQRWLPGNPVASDVIEWALGQGLVWNTLFVRKVLGKIPEAHHLAEIERLHTRIDNLEKERARASDERGKHHEEKRLAILGMAIEELAKNIPEGAEKIEGLFRGEKVNASAIANHLSRYQPDIGIPEEGMRGFAHRNVEDVLRKALASAALLRVSTDKS